MIKKKFSRKLLFLIIGLFIIIAAVVIIYFESLPKTFDDLIGRIAYITEEKDEIYKRLNREWVMPQGYVIKKVTINGQQGNWIYAAGSTSDKVIMQLHGGAYRKTLRNKRIVCQRSGVKYAQISNAKVLTIDYRIAPAYPYPAALEDSVASYLWLLKQGYSADNIIIAGDSAGGGLALATVLYLRDHKMPLPAAVITMSAWTNLKYWRIKIPYAGGHNPKNPYISPKYGDYHGFPPMLMQVGGDEMLLKDTTSVAKKAKADGVKVQLSIYDGELHVFQMLYPALKNANLAWDEAGKFINKIYGSH